MKYEDLRPCSIGGYPALFHSFYVSRGGSEKYGAGLYAIIEYPDGLVDLVDTVQFKFTANENL